MKKILFLLVVVLSAAIVSVSCKKDKSDEEAVYTSEAQKTKLQDIAIELMGKFNPNDQKKAVELADYLGALYEDYEWDFSEVEDHYKDDYEFLFGMNRKVRNIAQGDVTANFATDLFQKAAGSKKKIYKFANIDAEWEADEAAHKWRYKGKGNGGLVLKFKGPNNAACEAKLSGVDGDITYSGTDVEFEATLPKKVNFYLKEGNTEHVNMEMNFDVQKNDHLNFDFTTKITNITIVCGVKVSKTAAGCVYLVKRGNEELIKAVVDLKNCGLLEKADNQDWEDWFEMYGDMLEANTLQMGSAVAQVDILGGKLSLRTTTTDGTQFKKDMEQLDDQYEKQYPHDYSSSSHCYHSQSSYNKDKAKLLNQFLNVGIYYGGSKSVEAQMKWEASYYDTECWNSQTQTIQPCQHWDCDPVIYFPADNTTYNFEKYFTEKAFEGVINSAEGFINSYIRLSKRWGEGHEIEF